LHKPSTVVGRIKKDGVDSVFENPQRSLFRDDA
jgi:hypothetical protein